MTNELNPFFPEEEVEEESLRSVYYLGKTAYVDMMV